MRNIIMIAFLFLGFALAGCYDMHGTVPVTPMADTGPMLGCDAGITYPGDGGPIMVQPDAWVAPAPDAGTDSAVVIEADAGSDAFVPPMDDAGSDAGADSAVVEGDAGPVPDFVILADNMRQSAILVGGTGDWNNVAQYRVDPDETVTAVDVVLDGDAADVQSVAIAYHGTVLGMATFPAGTGASTRIVLDTPFITPMDGTDAFQVWVRIPPLTFNAATGGTHDGAALSGDSFRIGVQGVQRLFGSTFVSTSFAPIYGNEFVIRRSKPTVTRATLSTTNIANGTDQDLYRFQVSADSAGSISMRQVLMGVLVHGSTGYEEICNMRLRRGSTDLAPSDYVITALEVDRSGSGAVYESPCVYGRAGSGQVIIRFTYEETVSGSGNVYTLHGTPNNFVSGDVIETGLGFGGLGSGFHQDTFLTTGYIVSGLHTLEIDRSPYGVPGTGSPWGASFLWSDLSEVPHSSLEGTSGGSRDWTDGLYVEDLTQTQTLIR